MKTTLTTILTICSLAVFGQKKDTLKVADSATFSSAHFAIGTIGQTFIGYQFSITGKTPEGKNIEWVAFKKDWYIDNPDNHNGNYILHIRHGYIKRINDTTAIYYPKRRKLVYVKHRAALRTLKYSRDALGTFNYQKRQAYSIAHGWR